jgi:hypothetical protein
MAVSAAEMGPEFIDRYFQKMVKRRWPKREPAEGCSRGVKGVSLAPMQATPPWRQVLRLEHDWGA